MSVTILDIASATGFSKATVSRAFINPELLQPDTLKTILDAAARMGYRPNAIARAMITKRTGNLAFIIIDDHEQHQYQHHSKQCKVK